MCVQGFIQVFEGGNPKFGVELKGSGGMLPQIFFFNRCSELVLRHFGGTSSPTSLFSVYIAILKFYLVWKEAPILCILSVYHYKS